MDIDVSDIENCEIVTNEEKINWIKNRKSIDFTNFELQKFYEWFPSYSEKHIGEGIIHVDIESEKFKIIVVIRKYDDDYYTACYYECRPEKIRKANIIIFKVSKSMKIESSINFICDQFDGLESFISFFKKRFNILRLLQLKFL